MDFTLSGNALKTFARSITCLARIGNELVIQASPSQLVLHSLNSSRSAYQSITLKPNFFDVYMISGAQVQCSVLLKAVCAVLRTPIVSIDNLNVRLADPDAPKVQWTLECYSGIRKSYSITCNVEPDIQQLALDRTKYRSSFIVRPRDLNRLLANFQSSLQEITIIVTELTSVPSDAANEIGGRAVELRSYLDPTKENDSSLHTQLWIDPTEEFVQYTHSGNPVDVTFGLKELKAFLTFCEACEVDIHLFLEKAGEPILMAPKFGLDDGSSSNFDATLVLATMLVSQLHEGNHVEHPPEAREVRGQNDHGESSHAQQGRHTANVPANVPEHPSDHTKIWSELSGSAAKSAGGSGTGSRSGVEERQVVVEGMLNNNQQKDIQRISTMKISENRSVMENRLSDRSQINTQNFSQHHPSNWVDADEDEDDGEDSELLVQPTPPYYEDH